MPARPLVLASTSPYRRELLGRLGLAFEVIRPEVDEASLEEELPAATALRLALAKAEAVAGRRPDAVVIGSDQVAELEGAVIGKPGDHAGALRQLGLMSGRSVVFHTGVAFVCHDAGYAQSALVPSTVRFRVLDRTAIEAYLRQEQPYDCAGSAKAEGLGIALLESIDSADPTALIGLPLIRTLALLREAGIDPLASER